VIFVEPRNIAATRSSTDEIERMMQMVTLSLLAAVGTFLLLAAFVLSVPAVTPR
jgi:hypothetical protein